ncbi:MFS transporter [Nguyenibacter vanlangensis]|uniref:MFS transporter n=1 Tax=Nguyenibacter vanlangensis TaxID=1216886 RepID=A0A7Y7IT82_9PROT|nr:MFS transporter [Nguyenibacter vanlangensis]NVN09888.1 MFS transporter [Nguyenibacter vanlangensis]
MPFQISALIERFHLSASNAGWFGFFEIVSLSVAMILAMPLLGHLSHNARAMIGAFLIVIGHVLVYLGPGWLPWIWACAIMGGAGYGLIFAAFISSVSSDGNPDRIYSLACGGGLVVVVAAIMAVPWTTSAFGALGPFLTIAALTILLAPFMRALGRDNPVGAAAAAQSRTALAAGTLPLLAMWISYSIGSSMVWSFADQTGLAIHVPQNVIVMLSSAGIVMGFLANMFGAVIAGRVSRVLSLVVGILGTALSCLLTALSWSEVTYCAGVLMYWIFVMIAYAYLLGAAAILDRSGRVGTLGGGCDRIAYAVGAPIGGMVLDHGSHLMLGVIGFLFGATLLPVCIPAIARALRRSQTSGKISQCAMGSHPDCRAVLNHHPCG